MTRIAVVILNYNGEALLRRFLPSVIQHSAAADIFVVDNGSSDNSVQQVTQGFPTVKVIALQENFGFCGGYNRGLQHIQADYYVLLNSDVQVTPGWLEPLRELLDSHEHIASVQPKIKSHGRRDFFEYAGAAGGFIDSFGYPFCRGRVFDHVEQDNGQYDDERPVFWTSGACMMIRAKSFHAHGGFDEDVFAHMEEIDLCWKLHRAGESAYYTSRSTVYHVGAGTLGYQHPRKTYLNFRNNLFLIFKHFDTAELWYKFPARLVLDWVAAVSFLLRGTPSNCLSVLRAHLAFFAHLGGLHRKRNAIRTQYPSYPRTHVRRGLIIYDYYFRRRKRVAIQ